MNVFQLCHRVPFPANDGGNIAMLSLSDSLIAQGVQLKMLALNTKKHFVDINTLPVALIEKYSLEAVAIDTGIRVTDAFLNLFSSESYNVKRFFSKEYEERLIRLLVSEKPDVVIMESLFMTPYLPAVRKYSKARIVLRAHNVEFIIWKRLADNERNLIKRTYLSFLAGRLRKYEAGIMNQVDAILPITVDDKSYFQKMGCSVPMHVTPVGIDAAQYPNQVNPSQETCLFHLGAMDWRPNLEGIEWLLDNCWPLIHEKFPTLKLFLAGRGFPQKLMGRQNEQIRCFGEIRNANEFMQDKQVLIVPLKSGGGMRVKIIQGMALGKTIISTTIGAEGIDYSDGKNILIANTPTEILAQVAKCMDDKKYCLSVGQGARELALSCYSNNLIGKKMLDFLSQIQ